MIDKLLVHELKACKKDLEQYYSYQRKSNIINSAVKKRRLNALDIAIKKIGGDTGNIPVQETFKFT